VGRFKKEREKEREKEKDKEREREREICEKEGRQKKFLLILSYVQIFCKSFLAV
jgi:hypothetical protein